MSEQITSLIQSQAELLPIREVVRLTGINPVTLRAWERRYGLIQPVRTDGGHRLYTQQDIYTLQEAMRWSERGLPMGKICDMLNRTHAAPIALVGATQRHQFERWQGQIRQACEQFNQPELERLYNLTEANQPLSTLLDEIWLPVWHQLMPADSFGLKSQWLLLDRFLRSHLIRRIHNSHSAEQAPVLVASLSEQCQELALLANAVLLGAETGRTQPLAAEQPLEELAIVCQGVQPQALVLFAESQPTQLQLRAAQKLLMAVNCPLAISGMGAELLGEALKGTAIANLGGNGKLMPHRLERFLSGYLDT